MLRFTLKMNVFPSICLETPLMCIETLRTGLVFTKTIDLRDHMSEVYSQNECFSIYLLWKPHKCVLKPLEQGSIFWDDQFEGSHAEVYSQNECFPIYLLGNTINVYWNPQNRACFYKTLIWGITCLGLLSKWMFFHLSPWKPHKCVLIPLEKVPFF